VHPAGTLAVVELRTLPEPWTVREGHGDAGGCSRSGDCRDRGLPRGEPL